MAWPNVIRRATAPVPAPQPWTPPTWAELVQDQSPRVFRLALRLTGNRADAEDLTQEVFIRAFRSIHKFQPGTLEGWLHRITTNLFLDSARRAGRVRLHELGNESANLASARTDAPDEIVDEADLDHDVSRALAALPPEYRAAVVLCDIEGLSYDEIAAVLDVKVGTVRSRIHRGRAQLRDALAHRAPAPGRQRYGGIKVETGPVSK